MKAKKAKNVRIIMMNPQDGQIYAMVNLPEFDLNDPYKTDQKVRLSEKGTQDYLNQKWRNHCVSDTYEPGSTFKVITAASALEANVVKLNDTFQCPGYKVVEDRRIRCHKTTGHGTDDNLYEGVQNSCNPVFMEVGARLGTERLFQYLQKFGVLEKTGIDLSGEAATIMHQKEKCWCGRACYNDIWTVLSINTTAAADIRKCRDQRRTVSDTTCWCLHGKHTAVLCQKVKIQRES